MAEEQRRQHVARMNHRQFVHRDVSSLAAEWVMSLWPDELCTGYRPRLSPAQLRWQRSSESGSASAGTRLIAGSFDAYAAKHKWRHGPSEASRD